MSHPVNKKTVFINAVEALNLKHPVVEIAEKTGYSKGNISEFLNEKNPKEPTRPFLLTFCKAFELDYDQIFSTKKPVASATGNGIPDPQAPGMYQKIIDELIESSRAQREISKGMQRISEALLEERQLIRDTSQAAINLVSKAAKDVKVLAGLDSSLNQIEHRTEILEQSVLDVQHAVVYGFAEVLKKKPEDVEALLHTGDWRAKSKQIDKKKLAGN